MGCEFVLNKPRISRDTICMQPGINADYSDPIAAIIVSWLLSTITYCHNLSVMRGTSRLAANIDLSLEC